MPIRRAREVSPNASPLVLSGQGHNVAKRFPALGYLLASAPADFVFNSKAALQARQNLLNKFRTQPGADDPTVKARAEERAAIAERRAKAKEAREIEKAERQRREEEEAAAEAARIAREKEEETERLAALEAEQKAKRDARYAARKERGKKKR